MYKLYYIVSTKTASMYIGMTGKSLTSRWAAHKHASSKGKKTALYDCMRKHGIEHFQMVLVQEYLTRDECVAAEIAAIQKGRDLGWQLLNITEGGDGGFAVTNVDGWKKKLSAARKGRKPALGMKHTSENKARFSEMSKQYWETNRQYTPESVATLSFKEARASLGISKTHYYRLKRALSNDQG